MPDWVKQHKDAMRKGVDLKALVKYDEDTKKNVKEWIKVDKKMKIIDNDGLAFSVTDDNEVLIGLIKSNVTLLIRDKAFAKIMKKLFLAYYNDMAEDISN